MKKLELKVNISTRLLLYFLFVTILPLFVLTLTSTVLLNLSSHDKLYQELTVKNEVFWKKYNDEITELKDTLIKLKTDKLKDYLDSYDSFKTDNKLKSSITDEINRILKNNNLNFVLIFDEKKRLIFSNTTNGFQRSFTNIDKPTANFNALINLFNQKNQNIVSTEIIGINDLSEIFKEKRNSQSLGFLAHIGLINLKTLHRSYYLFAGELLNQNSSFVKDIGNSDEVALIITQGNNLLLTNLKDDQNDRLNNFYIENFEPSFITGRQIVIKGKTYNSSIYTLKNVFGKDVFKLLIGIPEQYFNDLKFNNSAILFEIAILSALAGITLAYLLSKTITKPLSKVTNAARSIENGDFTKRVDVKTGDELGYLAQSFNSMAETLQSRNSEVLAYNKLLLDQNKKIEAIINSSVDGIVTTDMNWRITSVNPKIIEWLGEDKNLVLGKCIYDVITYKNNFNYILSTVDKGKFPEEIFQNYQIATIINMKDQTKIELDITYSYIKTEDSTNEDSYVLVLRDVTRKREIEKLKENFVATLTHDLRVPLLASVQTLEYLLKGSYGDLAEKQKFITEHLISSNKDLLRMVNIILDSYKYEAGKQTLVKRKTNLNSLINDCILEIEPLVREKNHELVFLPHSDNIDVLADRQELRRVVINLLSNAITYTQAKGKIEIYSAQEDNSIIVSIKDNGTGISDSSIPNLFERYSKESNTLRKIGTGLGLYLSKHIIEAHNGKIWVESVKNVGSTFYFSIPAYN